MIACYKLGANSYLPKPVDFIEFMETVKLLGLYWLSRNEPPPFDKIMLMQKSLKSEIENISRTPSDQNLFLPSPVKPASFPLHSENRQGEDWKGLPAKTLPTARAPPGAPTCAAIRP